MGLIDNVQQAGTASKGQKTQYLLLTSLREVISIGVTQKGERAIALLQPHVPVVLPILAQYADSSEESVRNVVSESLGHLLMIDQEPGQVKHSLVKFLGTTDRESWRVRASAVSAFRFAAAKNCSAFTIEPLKDALLQCLSDEELQVKKAAFHFVNVVCLSQTCGEIFRGNTEYIFDRIKEDSKQKPELIREVDLGPFKTKWTTVFL